MITKLPDSIILNVLSGFLSTRDLVRLGRCNKYLLNFLSCNVGVVSSTLQTGRWRIINELYLSLFSLRAGHDDDDVSYFISSSLSRIRSILSLQVLSLSGFSGNDQNSLIVGDHFNLDLRHLKKLHILVLFKSHRFNLLLLPSSLKELYVCDSQTLGNKYFQDLPKNLKILHITSAIIGSFKYLPSSLESIKFIDVYAEGFDIDDPPERWFAHELPRNLKRLTISSANYGRGQLQSLTGLPPSLEYLHLNSLLSITNVSALPNKLNHVFMQKCGPMITDVAIFPNTVKSLYLFDLPELIHYQKLPIQLEFLNIQTCPKITVESIENIRQQRKDVKVLYG